MTFAPDIVGAKVVPSPKFWHGRKKNLPVTGIVQHYTASQSEDALVRWMARHASTSSHLFNYREGSVVQMVRFSDRAFHAGEKMGKGFWPAGIPQPANVNHFTISIENCNAGWLVEYDGMFYMPKKSGDKWVKGVLYHGPTPLPARDHNGVMRWWEPYSEEQVASNIEILKQTIDLYPAIGYAMVGRHSDVSPHRKFDPGPLWPSEYIASEVFGTSHSLEKPETVPTMKISDSADDFIGFNDLRGDLVSIDDSMDEDLQMCVDPSLNKGE